MSERLNEEKPNLLNHAHTLAVKLAGNVAVPGTALFDRTYWVVMGTYGFAPYRTGGYSCSGW